MNMQALLKQAQKMQKEIAKAESELKEKEYTSTIGGGAVKVTVKGSMEITAIDIDDDLMNVEGKADLQDMILSAVNDALQQAVTEKESTMSQMTSGIKMPGGF